MKKCLYSDVVLEKINDHYEIVKSRYGITPSQIGRSVYATPIIEKFDMSLIQMDEITKAPQEPLTFDEFNFDELLCKYGPEGLWELSEKLKEIVLNDVTHATINNNLFDILSK